MIRECIAVAIGGMVGTLCRYLMVGLFSFAGSSWVPIATLLVNSFGCLAIGAITGWAAHHQCESHWMLVAIRIGVLGGLTTFSSFGIDVVKAWQSGNPVWAVGLVLLHVGIGLAAVVVGWKWTSN